MKPKLFISYSRREVPFVNHLVDHLEDDGFNVWLDYRSRSRARPGLNRSIKALPSQM